MKAAASSDAERWLGMARLAGSAGETSNLVQFCERAVDCSASIGTIRSAASLLAEHEQSAAAIRTWQRLRDYRVALNARLAVIRILNAERRHTAVVEEALDVIAGSEQALRLSPPQQNILIAIVRRLVHSAMVAGLGGRLRDQRIGYTLPAPLLRWIRGSFAAARFDNALARRHFEAGLTKPRLPKAVMLDLKAEIALLHARHYQFNEARPAYETLSRRAREDMPFYRKELGPLRDVLAAYGHLEDIRYPEFLIDIILDEAKRRPIGYEPASRHFATAIFSLGQGGSERQIVTLLQALIEDGRFDRLSLFVRSVDGPDRSFFLPHLRRMPVELTVYGQGRRVRSDIPALLPEIAGRDELIRAIDLLPGKMREDLVRLCRLYLDKRPSVVDLRSEDDVGAMACALAGVPRFILKRGETSPDTWGCNPLRANEYLRPLTHTFKRLLEWPGFAIVNNSVAGSVTDANWLGSQNSAVFRVVPNVFSFGPHRDLGRNVQLRCSLDIPDDAVVLGGSFRFNAVKRPMLWIDAARIVAAANPRAHFIIIGDGELREEVAAYAKSHGFAERLHLPGRVTAVDEWYRAMDILLLTSEREGLPNALIEAQQFGVPVVAADVGGAAETMKPGHTGRLVPAEGSGADFADTVLDALNDASWMAAARAHAPFFVREKFGGKRSIEALVDLYGIEPRTENASRTAQQSK